jgi:hypothetical protein
MLNKSQVENLAQPVVDIYNSLENDMLVNIAKRLAGKDTLLKDDPEAWKIQQLQNLGMLDKDNLNLIKKYAGLTSAQLNSILYGAGIDGLDETDGALQKATKKGAHLKVPVPVSESPAILNIIKAYQMQAGSILNFTNQTMLGQAKSIFVDIINRTTMDVISGFKSSDQALRSTIKQWAEYGVPALVDKAGKKWGPEGYVRMVVATTTHNTVHKMQDERFTQWGIDLVEVSSHSGARPLCAPYQGKIYRIDGSDKKYKNLYTDTSYGQPAGLFGINCGHHKYPYVEGISTQTFFPYPKEENDLIYQQSQQQRALERGIRKAKTQQEMYKALGDDKGLQEATALLKKRQSSMRDFIDSTGRTRRRDREQIVKTGDIKKKPIPKTPTDVPNIQQKVSKPSIPVPTPTVQKVKAPVAKAVKQITINNIDESTFNTIDSSYEGVKNDRETFSSMKNSDVKIAVKYTSNYYSTMNNHLRGLSDYDSDVQKECDHLIRVLKGNTNPMPSNIKLFRQMDSDALTHIFGTDIRRLLIKAANNTSDQGTINEARSAVVGGAIQDKAFTSTTHKEGAFGSFMDVKIDIHVPQGYKNGMFVESISKYSNEKEYLFNANTKFNIFDVVFNNGKIIFKVIPN